MKKYILLLLGMTFITNNTSIYPDDVFQKIGKSTKKSAKKAKKTVDKSAKKAKKTVDKTKKKSKKAAEDSKKYINRYGSDATKKRTLWVANCLTKHPNDTVTFYYKYMNISNEKNITKKITTLKSNQIFEVALDNAANVAAGFKYKNNKIKWTNIQNKNVFFNILYKNAGLTSDCKKINNYTVTESLTYNIPKNMKNVCNVPPMGISPTYCSHKWDLAQP